LLSKKNQKHKNILAKTIGGTKKISSPILGKIVTRIGQNVTRFCLTSNAPQKNFYVKIGCLSTLPKTCHGTEIVTRNLTSKIFSKLKLMFFQHCEIVKRWPKHDTISGKEIF